MQVLYRGFSTSYFFHVEGFKDLVNVGGLSELDWASSSVTGDLDAKKVVELSKILDGEDLY